MTDADYLRIAYGFAGNSGDLSTCNGVILVNPETEAIPIAGWNDIYPKSCDRPDRRERPLKYQWTEHAERKAIFHAAKCGVKTDGMVMYAVWAACADCGRAIVNAGIRKVVRHKIPQHDLRLDWAASIAVADEMFREAGVEVVDFEGVLGVKFLLNGEMIDV